MKESASPTVSLESVFITGAIDAMEQRDVAITDIPNAFLAVDDVMPQVLWTYYFLEEQGYKSKNTIIHQDNKSAMLLEKNGKWSSSKRTKHINVRCFL